ncbi:PqqD family protein [Phycicoccus sp. CSK15P-2]|uniref:PqqD family protein n=1 Tax=Phycicoccus sp. CSK15P-2 TaxID=2807627 RepID=UPI00194FFBD6|nr:PqqD family protein [Phycicoccus sp. CSK15P-2]MBM6404324.1 PqqD family protein [Phycicoccus sp. CSK15P-2]
MTTLRVSGHAAWVGDDEKVYVARVPDGPPLVLEGSAAVVWGAAVPGGALDEVVERVAHTTGVSAELVADDVVGFVDQLVAAGLLETRPAAPD